MPGIFDTDIFGGDLGDLPDGIVSSDAFEEVVHRELQREFSPESYEFQRNKERELVLDGVRVRIRPDEVVCLSRLTSGAQIVACVVDAKFRKRLTKEQAERVVFYGRMLAPEESVPRICIPAGCTIDSGAQALADAGVVEIRVVDEVQPGALVEVSPEQTHALIISATGRGGVTTDYPVERTHERTYDGETWEYRIRTVDWSDCFDARFVAVGENEVQSVMLTNNGCGEFSAKGIPEALFALVSRDSGRTLVSSANPPELTPSNSEYRTDDATKVWRRLVSAGRATYDEATDRFTYSRAK